MKSTLARILLTTALSLNIAGCLDDESMFDSASDSKSDDATSIWYDVNSEFAYVELIMDSDRSPSFEVYESLSDELCRSPELLGAGDKEEVITVLAWKGPLRLELSADVDASFEIVERPIDGCTDAELEEGAKLDEPSEEDLAACQSVKSLLHEIQARSNTCTSG